MSDSLLELRRVCKRFGATRALHNVDLVVQPGEVHALIGENGAGKSTLMKILSGAHQADSGTMQLHGSVVRIKEPAAARRLGIAMIYQELNLAPHLTVEENITLGMEEHRLGFVRGQADRIRQALNLLHKEDLPLTTPVRDLSISLQQVVEIARALVYEAKVIIMDEPTSSLTAADTRDLFEVIKRLRDNGIAVIYISHFLEEVIAVADRFTVLRDGETVGTGAIDETEIQALIAMMVGRTLEDMFPRGKHHPGDVLLDVSAVSGDPLPHKVSFQLRRGEILGVAGLVGAGRSETVRRIFGLDRAREGRINIGGRTRPLAGMTPQRALRLRIDYLSEDRKTEGLAARMGVGFNTTFSSIRRYAGPGGLINSAREAQSVNHWLKEMRIRSTGPDQAVQDLSGGNQQKVALARMLEQGADVVLLDEPTRGVDVGSKVEIYRLINRLAEQGKGVVFVSSYLPELLGVCDTIAVMHRGELSEVRPTGEWNEHRIMEVATAGQ
jgi:ribose transport system ATP-binding protein